MSSRLERPAGRRRRGLSETPPPEPPAAPKQTQRGPDWVYLASLAALVSLGFVMMYSTTALESEGKVLLKLAIGLVGGLILLWLGARAPIDGVRRLAPFLLVGCFAALISLKMPGNPLAVTTNGATRWIRLPGGFTLQPSEYAKLAFVLFAANFLDKRGHKLTMAGGKTWGAFLVVLLSLCGLIYKEPDLGTALVLGGTAFCMLLVYGIDWRILSGAVLVLGLLVFTLAWNTDHQRDRLVAWWNPWAEEHRMTRGYQVIQSWTAMARGGITGVGMGQSTQKLNNRLPESETDFVFAIVAEEMGLLRAVGVLFLFGLFVWRGYTIAARAPDRYSAMLAAGFTSWVAVQTCLNISVATGTVPNTGVPLPFISSGLSSLTALMAAAGLTAGVSMRARSAR